LRHRIFSCHGAATRRATRTTLPQEVPCMVSVAGSRWLAGVTLAYCLGGAGAFIEESADCDVSASLEDPTDDLVLESFLFQRGVRGHSSASARRHGGADGQLPQWSRGAPAARAQLLGPPPRRARGTAVSEAYSDYPGESVVDWISRRVGIEAYETVTAGTEIAGHREWRAEEQREARPGLVAVPAGRGAPVLLLGRGLLLRHHLEPGVPGRRQPRRTAVQRRRDRRGLPEPVREGRRRSGAGAPAGGGRCRRAEPAVPGPVQPDEAGLLLDVGVGLPLVRRDVGRGLPRIVDNPSGPEYNGMTVQQSCPRQCAEKAAAKDCIGSANGATDAGDYDCKLGYTLHGGGLRLLRRQRLYGRRDVLRVRRGRPPGPRPPGCDAAGPARGARGGAALRPPALAAGAAGACRAPAGAARGPGGPLGGLRGAPGQGRGRRPEAPGLLHGRLCHRRHGHRGRRRGQRDSHDLPCRQEIEPLYLQVKAGLHGAYPVGSIVTEKVPAQTYWCHDQLQFDCGVWAASFPCTYSYSVVCPGRDSPYGSALNGVALSTMCPSECGLPKATASSTATTSAATTPAAPPTTTAAEATTAAPTTTAETTAAGAQLGPPQTSPERAVWATPLPAVAPEADATADVPDAAVPEQEAGSSRAASVPAQWAWISNFRMAHGTPLPSAGDAGHAVYLGTAGSHAEAEGLAQASSQGPFVAVNWRRPGAAEDSSADGAVYGLTTQDGWQGEGDQVHDTALRVDPAPSRGAQLLSTGSRGSRADKKAPNLSTVLELSGGQEEPAQPAGQAEGDAARARGAVLDFDSADQEHSARAR
ncbi:unnamed protein product, partial [Prorocentrum cordatum]